MKNLANHVQLIGNLGAAPELKTFESGKKMVSFTLATSESYTNQQGQKVDETQWHRLVAWGKTAEFINNYLDKGHRIAVGGKLVHRSYNDKDNQTRYITEVIVNEVLSLNTKKAESAA